MVEKVITVPDVGEAEGIELVEVLVAAGDSVTQNQSLVVLESDKASVELPAAFDGLVLEILMLPGAIVKEGDALMRIEKTSSSARDAKADLGEADLEMPMSSDVEAGAGSSPAQARSSTVSSSNVETSVVQKDTASEIAVQKAQNSDVNIPDLGQVEDAEVIEISCGLGDTVVVGQVLLLLESDKASLEITAEAKGVVTEIQLAVGDKVMGGELALVLSTTSGVSVQKDQAPQFLSEGGVEAAASPNEAASEGSDVPPAVQTEMPRVTESPSATVIPAAGERALEHAGPAVRKLAREFGVVLSQVQGSGPNARILKEDLHQFVKNRLSRPSPQDTESQAAKPLPDFSRFGSVEFEALPRIRKASARNLHSSWRAIPHVTHFDSADITDLESFRASLNQERGSANVKISPLAFVLKAVVQTLKQYPRFNSSLDPNFEHWVVKRFFNIGIAVETPNGLVVPNIKAADLMSISALAEQAAILAEQARNKKLAPEAMQGTTFTVSSLGGIGGTGFTPIVNSPEVAILGVARMQIEPRYINEVLVPRKILPLALSYDHRAIDGAEAARFVSELTRQLSDIRYLSV